MVSMACGKEMQIKYINNNSQVHQITNEENSVRANLLILKLPRKLIVFINNIYPYNGYILNIYLLINYFKGEYSSIYENSLF